MQLQSPDLLHQTQRRNLARCAGVAVGAAALFALLTVLTATPGGPLAGLDRASVNALHSYARRHTVWTASVRTMDDLGGPATMRVLLGLAAVWLLRLGARTLAGWAAALALVGWAAGRTAQWTIARPRPHFTDPVAQAAGPGYPSGRAMAALITCTALAALLWPRATRAGRVAAGSAATLAVATVGFTGIALGTHRPSDVLAGWLGAAVVLGAVTAVLELLHPGGLLRDSHRVDWQTRPRVRSARAPTPPSRHVTDPDGEDPWEGDP
ncbi:phosphatase PAP2 family protein [Kitasatospora sp. MBT63]|uniref:phosphatase PAP2 family protein n=1 Tax=Kitasatospora sp. MBT63 TaxID=1444768 RepID=UPI001314EB53|nr:phosphatase PAP2 family protein [Kitasatospora sp. MBT63]